MMNPQNTGQTTSPVDFEDFFERSVSGFLVTDAQGVIVKSNTRISDWTGLPADQLVGKRFSDLFAIGSKIYYETHLWPLLRIQGFFEEVLIELTGPEGQKLSFLLNALERRDDAENAESVYFIVSKAADRISYEKNLQYEKQIAESKLQAEKEMVALREQLIAVLGHDLRNPLASVLFAAEMLSESLKEEKYAEVLAILKRSGLRMNELIGTIMDFAKTRLGGGLFVEWQEATLQPVLQQVVDELVLATGGREIASTFAIQEPVYCDPYRIAQLLSNLLANALTHGADNTPIRVSVSHQNGNLEFSVSNEGEKIPDELLENIFEPFTREGNRKSQNGLGLGLYISSEIARAHRAELTCTSSDKETCFRFYMAANHIPT